MSVIQNEMKRKLRAGTVALGFGVHHLRTAAAGLLAAATDHDWLFIDMEHGAFSIHEASQICLAALSTGVTPLVRPCAEALDEGARALDNGALGVIAPHVETAEAARDIARAFRYPPAGARSWGGPPAVFGFKPPPHAQAQAAMNEEVLVIAIIESETGAANVADIASVPGIDCLLIGTLDLAADMGIPGQVQHLRVQGVYERAAAACRRTGKFLGMGGIQDDEVAARYLKLGVNFVLTGTDHSYLLAGAGSRSAFFRRLGSGQR